MDLEICQRCRKKISCKRICRKVERQIAQMEDGQDGFHFIFGKKRDFRESIAGSDLDQSVQLREHSDIILDRSEYEMALKKIELTWFPVLFPYRDDPKKPLFKAFLGCRSVKHIGKMSGISKQAAHKSIVKIINRLYDQVRGSEQERKRANSTKAVKRLIVLDWQEQKDTS
jgi:hypothetical protein